MNSLPLSTNFSLKSAAPQIRAEIARLQKQRTDENQLAHYRPYSKQRDFHAAGSGHRERLFMAGNQLGKTVAGGAEAAIHATGLYPDWWKGRRFDKPSVGWAAGVTGESTRDTVQRILLGRPGQHGTGSIPKAHLIETTAARGISGLIDIIRVRHVSGAESIIGLKSYEKGREKWQGETLDWVWFDEEPDASIYTEGLTRTNATGGLTWMTFTPLMGMSDVVSRFLMEQSPDRHITQMTIDDVGHYTDEAKARIIASYAPHERDARARGVPIMGSGRVFPVAEETISVEAFQVPKHWPQIAALDFGWDHPTAAVRLAWDRDDDVVYVTAAYRAREATPLIHSAALKPWGDLPWAWPHDGLQHDKGSGEQLADQYRRHGLVLLPERATFPDGSSGLEAGIMAMLERMESGRLRVFNHLNDWWEEFRLYHRQDGLIVKERDDLMAATRYGIMALRFARVPKGADWGKPNRAWVV